MSTQLKGILAAYAGVDAIMGGGPTRPTRADYPEEAFLSDLRAMQGRQNTRFLVTVSLIAAMFGLVLAFSSTNHFSPDIAKIALGSGGAVSVLSSAFLRGLWRDYTIIDLILTTLPLIAPQERKTFVLTVLTSLRGSNAKSTATSRQA